MTPAKRFDKRLFAALAILAAAAALGSAALRHFSPAADMRRSIAAISTQQDPAAPAAARQTAALSQAGPAASAVRTIAMGAEQISAQEIELAPAGSGSLARTLTVPGTITFDQGRLARVPGRVVGTVTEMRKRLGDNVAPGEIVAVLDSREVADAKSEYLTASVAYDLKKTLYERAQILWAKRISAEQQYLQARETFLEAELRLDLARQKLSALNLDPAEVAKAAKEESAAKPGASSLRRYEIRSLIGGRVIERKVDVGSLVGNQGDPPELYTIADLSVVWAEMALPTADLEFVEEGQRVIVSQGESGKRSEGRIIFISPLVDPNTRSARVIAEIENGGMIWRPGAVAAASIVLTESRATTLVPRDAVQTIGGEPMVFVRTASGFEARTVATGRSNERLVEILSGLSAGEVIAVKNTFLLKAELGKNEAQETD
jgi:cobalt-zinc-cadmium efflux system membrane fusion protein